MLRMMLKSALLISTFMATIVPAKAVEVYIFRGAGDASFITKRLSFSQGMDDLGDSIKAQGIFAEVYRWENGIGALNEIRRRKPKSVALLGHSMGALTSMSLAATLQKEGIKVSYMGLIDIPGPVGHVPSEVAIAENYYSLFPVYGMLPIPARHKGEISNKHVFGQIHTTRPGQFALTSWMRQSRASIVPGTPELLHLRSVKDRDRTP